MDLLPIIAAFGTKEKKICITMDPNQQLFTSIWELKYFEFITIEK